MPRRKKKTKIVKSTKNLNKNFLEQFKFSESYASLLLGIGVVILVSVLIFIFLKNRNTENLNPPTQEVTSEKTEKTEEVTNGKTYTIVQGDNLWTIAEKNYQSGYKWTEIAKANKIENPDIIHVGNKLTLPKVEVQTETAEKESNKIQDSSYTVQKGDYLWEIAVRAYGDGFKWTEIAKANNLANPDLIFSGNVLKIPR